MTKLPARSLPSSLISALNGARAVSSVLVTRPLSSLHVGTVSSRLSPLFGVSSVQSASQINATTSIKIVRFYGDGGLPPHKKIPLPALSPTMEKGTLVSWQKKEGDQLAEGDLLCEIETDKATMGFETPEEGYLAKILIPEGTKEIPIGKLVCIIVENEADVAAFKNYVPQEGDATVSAAAAPEPAAASPAATTAPQATPTIASVPSAAGDLPKHVSVPLPALSPTMEKGTLVSWQKKEGDELAEGDVLCEIETDKATMSFETPEEGYLAKILVPEGTKEIPVGQVVCVIVDKKESIGAFANYTPASMGAPKPSRAVSTPATPAAAPAPASRAPAPIPPSPTPAAAPAPAAPKTVAAVAPGGHVAATPYARKLAAERGVNLANIRGSGPGGRVLAADVEAAPVAGPPPPQVAVAGEASLAGVTAPVGGTAFVDIPLTNMRGTIAKRLLESKTTIPHYYLTSEILVDELMKIRKKLNELLAKSFHGSEKPPKISINDFIIKASALACMRVPEANSFFMGDFIRQNTNVDVSVAVSTDTGLITPIIFNANSKGLAVISQEIRELAAKAREGKLQPPEFQGGTFTVSNLGMYGSIHDFTAIINPPQSCILAVGGTEKKVVPDGDEGYKTVVAMNVTLSCDHRVVDGAIGAQWLKHFKSFLEKPHTMLL